MTEEAQRIAIATACGWTGIVRRNRHEFGGLIGVAPDGIEKVVPSFTRNLNDMHTAEKIFSVSDWDTYTELLMNRHLQWSSHRNCLHATASERAEAFLKTLNLWNKI